MSSSPTLPGLGELSSSPDDQVFINCPYDLGFRPRFDALVFTVVACGLSPRSALEGRNVSTPRIERILDATSKYSIHDRSRCGGEGDANLARFNMPLELGMAMAKRHADELSGGAEEDRHHWLALVPSDTRYAQ